MPLGLIDFYSVKSALTAPHRIPNKFTLTNSSPGTDHPFVPPLEEQATEWASVNTNYQAIRAAFGDDEKSMHDVLGNNAVMILNLDGCHS
jgi:hypothetical protein